MITDIKRLLKLHEAGAILTSTHLDTVQLAASVDLSDPEIHELVEKSAAAILALRDFEETFQRLSMKHKE